MAWTATTINNQGDKVITESFVGVASGRAFTSDINPHIKGVDPNTGHRYVTIVCSITPDVSGTNIDVDLRGAFTSVTPLADGTNTVQLLDTVVADMTAGDTYYFSAVIDLAVYPAAYRYLAFLVDASEAANTITVRIFVPGV